MALSSPGIGSGLDINGLVGQLMALERRPLTLLAAKEAAQQAKISAYGTIKGALAALQSAAQTLAKEDTFTRRTAGVGDASLLAASAASSAASGEYSIAINQLAQYHSLRSNGAYAATSDTFTTGTLSLSVGGGAPVAVAIDGTNNTLAGIRDAINAASAGVQATIVFDGTYQRLVLTSGTLGSAGAVSVTVTDDGSGGSHALAGLDSSALVELQAAQDAQFAINGLALTRSSNTVTDALAGVTLTLKKTGTTTLKVEQDTAAVTAAVNAFVKAYNDAVKQIRQASAYDAATKKAATLTGDATARNLASQLAELVSARVAELGEGLSRLSDLGIAMQKEGTLALDGAKLSEALKRAPTDTAALFAGREAGREGIAVRFDAYLQQVLGSDGLLAARLAGIEGTIKDIRQRSEALVLRLEAIEKRYRAQFAALDRMIASMTQTSNYLAQQLANLPGAGGSHGNR